MATARLAVLIACGTLLWAPRSAAAQSPTYGFGHPPTAEELKAIDIEVTPDGRGLPPGRGSVEEGLATYQKRCMMCHGPTGQEGPYDLLAGGKGSLATDRPLRTVGSYWPYATTLWDYINRAMPFPRSGTLAPDEVYGVVAYILYLNDIITGDDVMTEKTLPRIRMPNQDGFIRSPESRRLP